MSFQTITAQTVDYHERSSGKYVKDGVGFADPVNEFRLRPSTTVRKDGSVDISVTRVLEKDDVASDVYRQAVVTLNVSLPRGDLFTMAELDSLVTDISEFVTTSNLDRMLQGES